MCGLNENRAPPVTLYPKLRRVSAIGSDLAPASTGASVMPEPHPHRKAEAGTKGTGGTAARNGLCLRGQEPSGLVGEASSKMPGSHGFEGSSVEQPGAQPDDV